MAPYLLLGFLVAGILYIWIKPSFIQRHLGSGRFLPVVKTAIFGVPLPLCSCGVIPVAASLRRQGATKGATSAFLLSTPQTGVDSIAVTYSLLGGFFAVFRPIAALISGLVGGLLISRFDENGQGHGEAGKPSQVEAPAKKMDSANDISTVDACSCDTCAPETPGVQTAAGDTESNGGWRAGLRYGFNLLPKDIGRALVLGVIIAGVIGALAPPDLFANLPGGHWTQMIFMMLAGIPVYVCATASVPVAAALILKGISPGAALVFLITGPATNAATISTIWKIMGRKTAVIYLSVVAVTALASGTLVDFVLNRAPDLQPSHLHVHGLSPLEIAAGIFLIGMLVYAYRPVHMRDTNAGSARNEESDATARADTLTIRTLTVTGMHCSHCANAVKSAVENIPGVKAADVDLASGRVRFTGDDADIDRVKAAIRDLGYGTT